MYAFILLVSTALTLSILGCLLLLLLLLVVLGLLQADEVLTVNLVEFCLDVGNNFVDTRNKDELERVHTPVRHLKSRVESFELRLKRRNLHQDLKELCELVLGILD